VIVTGTIYSVFGAQIAQVCGAFDVQLTFERDKLVQDRIGGVEIT
jgi:hypothetical protein